MKSQTNEPRKQAVRLKRRNPPEPISKDHEARTTLETNIYPALHTPKMATYDPLPFPRRPKTPSVAGDIRYQAQLLYYRYEINTGLYVMSPGEKLAFNCVVLTIAALLLSVVYYLLPLSLVGCAQRLIGGVWSNLSNAGVRERKMQGALLQGLLPGEAAASLRESSVAGNASMAALPGIF